MHYLSFPRVQCRRESQCCLCGVSVELVYLTVQLVLTPGILNLTPLLQLRRSHLRLLNDSLGLLALQLFLRGLSGPLVCAFLVFLQFLLSLLPVHFFASLVEDLVLGDCGSGSCSVHHPYFIVALVVEGAAEDSALCVPEIVQ